jgi:hypothetical protein
MEELQRQLAEKDKTIQDLKEKTKSYILKIQTQHNEALTTQQEIVKDHQVREKRKRGEKERERESSNLL